MRLNSYLTCASIYTDQRSHVIGRKIRWWRSVPVREHADRLDTDMFENIDSDTIQLMSMTSAHGVYTLGFIGHLIANEMRVYDVKTIPHWMNLTESKASLIGYTGPPRVLVNLTSNCVLGIHDLSTETLS